MKTAWLFPGQGSQSVGMGRGLADASAAAREIFDRADEALGFAISKICFEGPEAELTLTANTQPAIVTTSLAALAALRERVGDLPDPAFAAGHSLGEYSALAAAGALELEDALRLVRLRGTAMQEAVPPGAGAMAAILGGDEDAVRRLCEEAAEGEALSPANFNAPGQIVIAGAAEAVARARELSRAKKLKAIPLQVSAPFHCELMRPAAEAVRAALADVTFGAMKFPVVANVDGQPNDDASRIAGLLVRQIDGPVLWEQSIRRMQSGGVGTALEIGAGRVLAGLCRKIDRTLQVVAVGSPEAVQKAAELLA